MARPKHGYTLADGSPVPGTTTITGMLNKPALVGWAGKTMHAAAVEHGKVCHAAGQAGDPIPAMEKWTGILYGQRDAAAVAGTIGHEMSQAWLRLDDPEAAAQAVVDEEKLSQEPAKAAIDAGRRAFDSFRRWWERSRYELVDMEVPLVSEIHRFGGTYDLLLSGPDGYELGDLKTGGTYPEHLLQVAAYGYLLRECRQIDVAGYHLLRITRNEEPDFHHSYYDQLADGWRGFELCRRLYDVMQVVSKRAK